MEGVALNEVGIMTLPTGLHSGQFHAGCQDILAVIIEQSKSWMEGRSLLNWNRVRPGKSRSNAKEGYRYQEQPKCDKDVAP
jgi:hypothetical protein